MSVLKSLRDIGCIIVETVKGYSWHLFDENRNSISKLTILINKCTFSFSTNIGGCGTLVMSGNDYFNRMDREKFEQICKIFAQYDAGTIIAVQASNDIEGHNLLLDFGFTPIAEYPNLRHRGYSQKLYIKTTLL